VPSPCAQQPHSQPGAPDRRRNPARASGVNPPGSKGSLWLGSRTRLDVSLGCQVTAPPSSRHSPDRPILDLQRLPSEARLSNDSMSTPHTSLQTM
jgi:hypothetical protein